MKMLTTYGGGRIRALIQETSVSEGVIMKKLLLLFLLSIVAATLFAMGCAEEGVHYLVDDFGDVSDEFWRTYSHCEGTCKLSSGLTDVAGLHIMLNNFNEDVIFSIQDQTSYEYGADEYCYDYVSENKVWSNTDCYLSLFFGGSVLVKIKFENGTVGKYNAELINDQISGTGAKKHVLIRNLYKDIVGQGNMMISISNNNVAYTFRNISISEFQNTYLHLMANWKISDSEIDSYETGKILSIWPGNHPSNVEKWGFETLEDSGTSVFYMTPGDGNNGPFYTYVFNENYSTLTLKDIETSKMVVLENNH